MRAHQGHDCTGCNTNMWACIVCSHARIKARARQTINHWRIQTCQSSDTQVSPCQGLAGGIQQTEPQQCLWPITGRCQPTHQQNYKQLLAHTRKRPAAAACMPGQRSLVTKSVTAPDLCGASAGLVPHRGAEDQAQQHKPWPWHTAAAVRQEAPRCVAGGRKFCVRKEAFSLKLHVLTVQSDEEVRLGRALGGLRPAAVLPISRGERGGHAKRGVLCVRVERRTKEAADAWRERGGCVSCLGCQGTGVAQIWVG